MAAGYFILTGNPVHVAGPFSWQEVEKRITPDKDGDSYYGADGFHAEVPQQDSGYFESVRGKRINYDKENPILIIKGEIVVPKSAKVVIKFEEP